MQGWLWLCLPVLLSPSPASAEVLTVTAAGEYRMTGQDTPEEGMRRSLQEANRLALERTWAQLLGLPEVKALGIGQRDLQDYTRGLIELTEGPSQRRSEGQTVTVRTEVKAKIDTVPLLRRINAARQSQSVGD